MAAGKHTFSLTLVLVTECAFCMHSWMNVVVTAFTAEFIAILWGAGILLFLWDWPKRKTALLFQSNALRRVLSQTFIDNQKPSLVFPSKICSHNYWEMFTSSSKSPAWEVPHPPELPVQWLGSSTVFPLLSSPNLSCCDLGLGNFPQALRPWRKDGFTLFATKQTAS